MAGGSNFLPVSFYNLKPYLKKAVAWHKGCFFDVYNAKVMLYDVCVSGVAVGHSRLSIGTGKHNLLMVWVTLSDL